MLSEAAIRALTIKKSRWGLLQVLKMFYPCETDFLSLALTLPTVELHHIKVDLSYLIDKGLVAWTNQEPNQRWDEREYKLTATGVETADRITADPALEP